MEGETSDSKKSERRPVEEKSTVKSKERSKRTPNEGEKEKRSANPPTSTNLLDLMKQMQASVQAIENRQKEGFSSIAESVSKLETDVNKLKKRDSGRIPEKKKQTDYDQDDMEEYEAEEEYDEGERYFGGFEDDFGDNEEDDQEDHENEEKEKDYEISFFSSSSRYEEASNSQVEDWKKFRMVSEELDPKAWQRIEYQRLVKKYTAHVSAKSFAAQEKDYEMPALRGNLAINSEKALLGLQKMAGANGAAISNLVELMKQLSKDQVAAMKSFKEETGLDSVVSLEKAVAVIEDIKAEAAMACEQVAEVLQKKFLPKAKDTMRLSALMFNKTCLERRKLYVQNTSRFKQADKRLAEYQPSEKFLFGGKVPDLATSLRDESHLMARSYPDVRNKFGGKFKNENYSYSPYSRFQRGGRGHGYARGRGNTRGRGYAKGQNKDSKN